MKPAHNIIIAGAGALLIVALLFQQQSLETDILILRQSLTSRKADAVQPSPEISESGRQFIETEPARQNRIGVPTDVTPQSLEEQVAELKGVIRAQANRIEGLEAQIRTSEEAAAKASAPSWGIVQAVGAPDTATAGDQRSAWAPLQQDGGPEWMELTFEKPVEIAQLMVRETYNPGAVVRITAVTDSGTEIPIWQGEDPGLGKPLSDSLFGATAGVTTGRVRVHLDTKKVPGWNEVDAVQLIGRDGSQQWAKSAKASSSYGGAQGGGLRTYDVFSGDTLLSR